MSYGRYIMNGKRALIFMVAVTAIAAGCAETIEPKSCNVSEQCESNQICRDSHCVLNPCLNGILSDGESDVDCGGVCPNLCEVGKKCNRDADCALNLCVNNQCVDYAADCEQAVAGDLIITEVLNNAAVNKTFDSVDTQQSEFIEIVNLSNRKVDLGTITVRCQRLDAEDAKPVSFKMSGCLGSMDVAVLSNTDIPVPAGGLNILSLTAPNQLANTGEYRCTLVQTPPGSTGNSSEQIFHTVTVPAVEKAGISAALPELQYTPFEIELLQHNSISTLNHSPGYCSNGRLYKNNCDTLCHDGLKNEEETDIDCGGTICGKCSEGKACLTNDDCLSGSCLDSVCQPESCVKAGCANGLACDAISGTCHSCEDQVQSGDESDIDCGGSVCNACALGLKCTRNSDCISQSCSNGVCMSLEVTCDNGQKDPSETDVDCGGLCAPCENGLACLDNIDCTSGFCDNGTCGTVKCTSDADCPDGICDASGACSSCSDGVKNGGETDTDCGGQICGACASGKVCQANIDCLSYHCQDFICEGDPLLPLQPNEIIINEVMGSPKSGVNFGTQSTTAQCEFVEIVSVADGDRLLSGWNLKYQKYDAATDKLVDKPVSVPLSGVIPSKGGVVANNCASLPLPDDMKDITLGKNQFVNAQDYQLWLENEAGDKTDPVLRLGTGSAEQGQSQTRSEDLSLTSPLVYHKQVSTLNSSPGYCANGGLFNQNCMTTCTNGKQDEDEADIDCGGKCGGCDIGKNCSSDKDCLSENCDTVSGTCAKAKCKSDAECDGDAICVEGACISCSDGILNGDEADIDCGGSCANACPNGRKCTQNADCKSYKCQSGYCNGTECTDPKAGDLVLTEFFNSVSPSASMSVYDKTATQTQVEFVEFANLTNSPISLRDVTIQGERQDSTGNVTAKLEGCVPPHQAVVVSGSALNGLPDGVVNIVGIKESGAFVNTGYYKMSLLQGSTVLHALTESVKPNAQVSRVPEVWNEASGTSFVNHNDINTELKHSPGYCTNGELFVDSCVPHCENGVKDKDESDTDCGGSCTQCGANKACHTNADCLSDECKFNKCSGGAILDANPADLIINEVMGQPDTASIFDTSSDNQCEFIEIVNLSNTKLRLDGLELLKYKSETETIDTATSIALTGILPGNEALVVSECESMTLPSDAHHLKASIKITNEKEYILALRRGTTLGDLVTYPDPGSKKGISLTRYVDLDASTNLVHHNTLGDKKNSPGYCANGKQFNTLCQ